jgi:hypothetical protein
MKRVGQEQGSIRSTAALGELCRVFLKDEVVRRRQWLTRE